MSEERLEQDESKETEEDVEAHKKRAANDEPTAEDESDDVEAHSRMKMNKRHL